MTSTVATNPQQHVSLLRDNFTRRASSAITHPVTLAALALLLANDLVFKSLWPGAWLTGKISDLAWLVVALPLLAFLLALLVRVSLCSPRVAYLASYVGLPLLYLAYNTFQTVHYWILKGISTASGGTAGSPQDVTDSLVIPLAWVVALWVWHRSPVSKGALRIRLALLVAAIASLASVATKYPETVYGITRVSIAENGDIHAFSQHSESSVTYRSYVSHDGGFTWESNDAVKLPERESVKSAESPRGLYQLDGSDIVLVSHDGSRRHVVHSTAYLRKDGNRWVQEQETRALDARKLAYRPNEIVYDNRTGNIIASLGIQGVLVGTRNGKWHYVRVGPFQPGDYTFVGKSRLLLSDPAFLVMAVIFTLSMTAMGLTLSQINGADGRYSLGVLALRGLLIAVGGALLVGAFFTFGLFTSILGFLPLLLILALLAAFAFGFTNRKSWVHQGFSLVIAVLSLCFSGLLLFIFGNSDSDPDSSSWLIFLLVSSAASFLAVTSLIISWRLMRHWKIISVSAVAMFGLIVLTHLLWLHLGIALILAKISAIVFVAIVGYLLSVQIRQRTQEDESPCPGCGKPNDSSAKFCDSCGTFLKDEVDPQMKLDIPALQDRLLAGFDQRLPAILLDWVAVALLSAILGSILIVSTGGHVGLSALVEPLLTYFLPALAYGVLLLRFFSATLGKKFLGIQVMRTDGSRVGWTRSFIREFVKLTPLLFISVFMILIRHDKRGLHDLLADTVVVHSTPGIPAGRIE